MKNITNALCRVNFLHVLVKYSLYSIDCAFPDFEHSGDKVGGLKETFRLVYYKHVNDILYTKL